MSQPTDEWVRSRTLGAVCSAVVVVCFFLPWKSVFGQVVAGYEVAQLGLHLLKASPGEGLFVVVLVAGPAVLHAFHFVLQARNGSRGAPVWIVGVPLAAWVAAFLWVAARARSVAFAADLFPSKIGGVGTALAMVVGFAAALAARKARPPAPGRGGA